MIATHAPDLTAMVQAYHECALWSSIDNDDTPLDASHEIDSIARESDVQAMLECYQFAYEVQADITTMEPAQVGHDFWLTRNHHGAGFWDRGLGEQGERLTEAAHAWGSCDAYVGDDGQVHYS